MTKGSPQLIYVACERCLMVLNHLFLREEAKVNLFRTLGKLSMRLAMVWFFLDLQDGGGTVAEGK